MPLTLLTARAATRLRAMLDRGFTTVRDTGGCDWGIKTGVEQGHLVGPAPLHRRTVDRAHGRPLRRPAAHRQRRWLRLLQRPGLQVGDRRRHRRGAQGRARADAPGRRPREDHDVGRRRLALRPARQPAVLRRRGARGGGGGDRLRPLCVRPRLFRRGDHARGPAGRAHHRARQPDRRCGGQADGREGHVPGRQPRRLLRHEGAGGEVRHDAGEPGEERHRPRRRLAVARDLQAPRRAGRLRQRPAGRAALGPEPRVLAQARGGGPDRDHPLGNDHRRRRSCASKARSARSRPAPSPICWWSTAIPCRTLRCWRIRASISPSS